MNADPASDWRAPTSNGKSRLVVGYVAMLVATVVLFLLIRAFGEAPVAALNGRLEATAAPQTVEPLHTFRHVLIALTAILITARATGWLFSFLGQPRVIGEVVAGLLLGPSSRR